MNRVLVFAFLIGLLLIAGGEAAQSPTWSISCPSIGGVASQQTTWAPGISIVTSATVNIVGNGIEQPLVFAEAPDGQVTHFLTIEDYQGSGGSISYTVNFSPDWLVLPNGTHTVTAIIFCSPPAQFSYSVRLD
ncbi:MAG TPA: hypothetical protein VNP04_19530 [Alphaproteobacteria bacterium]|nr:hypothetical protein [Alphaproteobacteria bacterium]